MTCLIACLTTGKGTWSTVNDLMNSEAWEKTFLITNDFGKEKFTSKKPFEFIMINPDSSLQEIKNNITLQLKGKIKDLEVAVNLSSGSGKEHMALLSAILSLGYGLRIVDINCGKIEIL
ncbi:MAG: hypothetical protein ACP5N2_04730 [Candidatus Nanoarchaeia archaeon]